MSSWVATPGHESVTSGSSFAPAALERCEALFAYCERDIGAASLNDDVTSVRAALLPEQARPSLQAFTCCRSEPLPLVTPPSVSYPSLCSRRRSPIPRVRLIPQSCILPDRLIVPRRHAARSPTYWRFHRARWPPEVTDMRPRHSAYPRGSGGGRRRSPRRCCSCRRSKCSLRAPCRRRAVLVASIGNSTGAHLGSTRRPARNPRWRVSSRQRTEPTRDDRCTGCNRHLSGARRTRQPGPARPPWRPVLRPWPLLPPAPGREAPRRHRRLALAVR